VVSDLRYYAIPDLQKRLQSLEAAVQAQHDATGVVGTDTVTPEAIAEIVGRWTGIPVTRLLSTERDKLIQMEKTLSSSVGGFCLVRSFCSFCSFETEAHVIRRSLGSPKQSKLLRMRSVFHGVDFPVRIVL
jgi:hypothetical protein